MANQSISFIIPNAKIGDKRSIQPPIATMIPGVCWVIGCMDNGPGNRVKADPIASLNQIADIGSKRLRAVLNKTMLSPLKYAKSR